jgi:hypothetical protein
MTRRKLSDPDMPRFMSAIYTSQMVLVCMRPTNGVPLLLYKVLEAHSPSRGARENNALYLGA